MTRREYDFSDKDFDRIRKLVAEYTGISLSSSKKDLVYGRISKRLRALKIPSFSQYIDLISGKPGEELEHFTNAITTNLTSFFRESHHFDYLENTILPDLKIRNAGNRRIRIWSAGCSTGEEPYSIAMSVLESFANASNWDIKILATDLDSRCVKHAAAGIYDLERVESIERSRLRRWFRKGRGQHEGKALVDPRLKEIITFKQLNLMGAWPMRGPFDVIFCRNVVIYFDKPTQRILFERFADLVADDAHLVLGHSESMHNLNQQFKLLHKTIYRRAA